MGGKAVYLSLLPLRGLVYIVQHRVFPLKSIGLKNLGLNVLLSAGFLLALYTRWRPLQGTIVHAVLGASWLGFAINQTLLAVEACITLYMLLRRTLASASTTMFDAVLAHRGLTKVEPFPPAELEAIRTAAAAAQKRQREAEQRRGLPYRLLRFALRTLGQRIVTAPLMLVPGVGWAAYMYTNAVGEGAACHQNFFKRKGAGDASLQKAIVSSRSDEYRVFGSVALLMNLVPVLNYVLNFGNAAGAALWAADIETSGQKWLQPDSSSAAAKQA